MFGMQQKTQFTLADKKHFMRDIEKAILTMYPNPYLNQERKQCKDAFQLQEKFKGRCIADFQIEDSSLLDETMNKTDYYEQNLENHEHKKEFDFTKA